MPGLDGMGVIRRLREKEIELPYFIFVTAHDQYAVEAFRLEAMDYLLKPVGQGPSGGDHRPRATRHSGKAEEHPRRRPGRPCPRTKLPGAFQQPELHRGTPTM